MEISSADLSSPARTASEPVSLRFVLAYAVAQSGAFLAFLPLLSILIPEKVQLLAPGRKQELLAELLFCGAIVASAGNYLGGALSDWTPERFGRRRPWIVAGAFAVALSYGLIATAADFGRLFAALMAFQLLFNLMFAPLVALLADWVPDRQKGRVVAALSFAPPAASVLGALIAGRLPLEAPVRYGLIASLVLSATVPFALAVNRRDLARPASPLSYSPPAKPVWRDLGVVWSARFLAQTANAMYASYLLFFFHDVLRHDPLSSGRGAAASVANQSFIYTGAGLAAALIGGFLSDRTGRRKDLILAGAGSMAAGLLLLSISRTLDSAYFAAIFVGAGFGCCSALDGALGASLAGRSRGPGRSLGVLNLAYTAPQAVGPALAALILSSGRGYPALYMAAAALALLGGVCIQLVREPGRAALVQAA